MGNAGCRSGRCYRPDLQPAFPNPRSAMCILVRRRTEPAGRGRVAERASMLRDGAQAGGAGSLAPRVLVVTAALLAAAIVEPLRNEGYRVGTVVNASELQSLLDAGQRPDLVILD